MKFLSSGIYQVEKSKKPNSCNSTSSCKETKFIINKLFARLIYVKQFEYLKYEYFFSYIFMLKWIPSCSYHITGQ